jgi:abortive infection bacteriophage resistance protein
MRYAKPPLSFGEQADLLLSRGLIADKSYLLDKLKSVSYYRLSGYLFPFRNPDDSFKPGTLFETVWQRYTFDRQLRLLVLDAIERIEIAVRTNLVYNHVHKYGPFGYQSHSTLPNISHENHADFIQRLSNEQRRNKEIFVKHFSNKYGDSHRHPPFWMTCEIMTFGMTLTLVNAIEKPMRQELSAVYGVPDNVFLSWIRSINGIRNICAHHSRLWNREVGYKPDIPRPRKNPQWHAPVQVKGNRIFGVLTVMKYLMNRIAPQSNWKNRLEDLLARYPEIPLRPMGFTENWKECPIWTLM